MKKAIVLIILSSLLFFCSKKHGGLDPPFRLKWGMTPAQIDSLIALGDCDLSSESISPKVRFSRCENLSAAYAWGNIFGNRRIINVYFWNDSLFEMNFFVDPRLKIDSSTIDSIFSVAVPLTSADSAIIKNYYEKKNYTNSDIYILYIKKYILSVDNLENRLNKINTDTVYHKSPSYQIDKLEGQKETISYIGYDSSAVVLDLTSSIDGTGVMSTSNKSKLIWLAFRSSKFVSIEKQIEDWKKKTNSKFLGQGFKL